MYEYSHLRIPVEDLVTVFSQVGARWNKLKNKKIFLTGATGFIGKWLLASFLYANREMGLNAKLVALSRDPESFFEDYPEIRDAEEIVWLAGDVRNLGYESIADCSYVIHAATDVSRVSSPYQVFDTCNSGTRNLLDILAHDSKIRRMVLLSSGAIYGRVPPEMSVIPEEWLGGVDPLLGTSAYAEGKRVSELLCSMATAERPELEVSIARCFAFVGPHLPLDKHFAIGNFISAAISGTDICLNGDGTPLRSYLYAADLTHWLWIMLFEAESGRAYNVGGEEAISIGALAHRINILLDGVGEVKIEKAPRRPGPPDAYVPAIGRIASELGLIPSISLDEAIIRTARWATNMKQQVV